jgi:hypothetical protein
MLLALQRTLTLSVMITKEGRFKKFHNNSTLKLTETYVEGVRIGTIWSQWKQLRKN